MKVIGVLREYASTPNSDQQHMVTYIYKAKITS
jgi:hypothetical protein